VQSAEPRRLESTTEQVVDVTEPMEASHRVTDSSTKPDTSLSLVDAEDDAEECEEYSLLTSVISAFLDEMYTSFPAVLQVFPSKRQPMI